jgi:general stress protein 26
MKDHNEDNHIRNLEDREAIQKLKTLVKHNNICMFITFLTEIPMQARPMSAQEVDNEGNLWFLSSKSSNKNFEIGEDARVQFFFANTGNSEYLSIYGHAEVLRDREKIEQIWSPIVKAWFQEGKDDPDLSVIKVTPEDINYWDTKNSKMVSLFKIMTSVVSGKTMDDGVEGKLRINK